MHARRVRSCDTTARERRRSARLSPARWLAEVVVADRAEAGVRSLKTLSVEEVRTPGGLAAA